MTIAQSPTAARVLLVGGCDEAILSWGQQAVLLELDVATCTAHWCYVELDVRTARSPG